MTLIVLSAQAFASLPSYSGSLSGADGGLLGTGSWLDKLLVTPAADQAGWFEPSLSWTVSQNQDSSWRYNYTLSVYKKGISHLIVEASPSFSSINIWNANGPFSGVEIQDYQPGGSSNPNMPGAIHGIKFDSTNGTTVNVQFDSDRMPVWGDFYSKGGKDSDTKAWNTVWNAGFTSALPHLDPVAPAANGSYLGHLLVPDTFPFPTPVVPEPASFVCLAAGLMGILGFKSRSRR